AAHPAVAGGRTGAAALPGRGPAAPGGRAGGRPAPPPPAVPEGGDAAAWLATRPPATVRPVPSSASWVSTDGGRSPMPPCVQPPAYPTRRRGVRPAVRSRPAPS